ncbi:MAG: hemolysin family protein [Planctomycetota bacterium]
MNDAEPSTSAPVLLGALEPSLAVPAPALVALAAAALVGSGLFAFTRVSLMRSVPARVLATVPDGPRRQRLGTHLANIETLVTSAGLLRVACDLAFAFFVLVLVVGDGGLEPLDLFEAAAIAVPLLALAVEIVPQALVETRGDPFLRGFLGWFHLLQVPIVPVSRLFAKLRTTTARSLGALGTADATRRIVEELREAVHESELETELDATEREIIENVMEFHDVDVAAIMTPRTEIEAVEVGSTLRTAIARAAECGHGRLLVYRGSLDEIVGSFSARDVLEIVAVDRIDEVSLESIVRPTAFVPETKRVSQLLEEFRRQRIKIAVVVDEYGGTAGLVTMGDVLAELVGDLQDEFDEREEPEIVRKVGENVADVAASVRVSEVNEELDLDLPEDGDYETLGGFVLAELGRFPGTGEQVTHGPVTLTVTEANERRVLSLRIEWVEPTRQAVG